MSITPDIPNEPQIILAVAAGQMMREQYVAWLRIHISARLD